jgi:F420-dependent oxidoreductase-like protein
VTEQAHPWPRLVERWQEAEELGFDTAWVIDHLMSDQDRPYYEAWTLLAGLAAVTTRIRLGVMVTGNTYRNPALLAKEAVTVDHISGGRLELGLGAGWWEREHDAYGYDFPGPGELVDRLDEAVRIIEELQRNERTTFEGRYYRLDDAPFTPKPIQQPRLPLLIGGRRPRMLRLVARYADGWNTRRPVEEAAEMSRRLDEHCREIGRDPATLVRSVLPAIDVFTSLDDVRNLVDAYAEIGFTDFVFVRPDDPDQEAVMRQAATEVFPAIR